MNLAASCEKIGLGYFLWKREFLSTLRNLDERKRHTREEIEEELSSSYIEKTASAYGIRMGGRAVNIEEEFGKSRPIEEVLNDKPCGNLLSTDHFHVDMDGYFIPPGCTGLRLPLEETVSGIPSGNYEVFETLYTGGINALYNFAVKKGFVASEKGYTSRCNLCFHIRKHLAAQGYPELDEDFYIEALKYY
jgi:hypothetical protein